MAAPVRYEMTAREKQIEELYLGIIARILQAKDDEAKQYRHEITHLADRVLALRSEIDARKPSNVRHISPLIQEYRR
jgi:hypothetical protein